MLEHFIKQYYVENIMLIWIEQITCLKASRISCPFSTPCEPEAEENSSPSYGRKPSIPPP